MKLLTNEISEKVLGLLESRADVQAEFFRTSNDQKKKILSQIARIFDPLCFAAAFTVKAKIGMQRLWQKGVDWDEQLPADEESKWIELFAEIREMNDITIERCLLHQMLLKTQFGCRGEHVKNVWGGVGHSGPTFYKNSFAKESCHRCTDLYFYHPG